MSGSADWLTGLPDIDKFYERAKDGVRDAAAHGTRLAIAAFDLMGMRPYNARYGHERGDVLLRLFSDLLKVHFGAEACAHFAEDHFCAFALEDELASKANALFVDFASYREMRTLPIRAGAYVCDPEDDIAAVAMERARIACDLDRKTWRSHLTWFNDDMRETANLRAYVLEHVDQAIEQDWIRPFYQPIVRSSTGDLCGEEALARWIDPEYGMLTTDQFIPALEEAGLLDKVDLHMISCVVSDMLKKQEHGIAISPVSVNLSQRDLESINIADEVAKRVDAAGVTRSLIRIELTESAALGNPELFKKQVDALHDAGFEVWMDDFGSGYSALNTLQEFDFDLIKLDMGLISYSENRRSRSVISGVVQIAERLGVGTLAEGVETEQQANLLASIGCGMQQGFFYSEPLPLDVMMDQFEKSLGIPREPLEEEEYWNAVGKVNLYRLAIGGSGPDIEKASISGYPAGVLELREGVWRFLRVNRPYRDFLVEAGFLSSKREGLKASPAATALDKEFLEAVKRCNTSGEWEQVAGRLEYGTGLHYRVKHAFSTKKADAYLVAAAPATFGTALGVYGDLPIAYAVFRVMPDDAHLRAIDAEYVYANSVYCEWGGIEQENVIGKPFFEAGAVASEMWLPYFYRAAVLGENVHDIVFSPEAGHWLSFYLSPSPIENCCVLAFAIADDERREREEVIADRDTSDFIIEMLSAMSLEEDYHVAIERVLDTLGTLTRSDYVTLFVLDEDALRVAFSWSSEGSNARHDVGMSFEREKFDVWAELFADSPDPLYFDVEKIDSVSDELRQDLQGRKIERLISAPISEDGKFIGFIALENCSIDRRLDVLRVLKTASVFIGTRIANHRLLGELEYASTHDALTGLLNRFGADIAIEKERDEFPDKPFALALLDVDNFKTMNDLYGHVVGDEALRQLARVMKCSFSSEAVLARNGGDEFLIMLPDTLPDRAEELYKAFSEVDLSFERRGKRYRFTTSLGYACWPEQAHTLEGIYTRADNALYAVKLTGKSGYKKYSTDLKTQFRSQLGFTPRDIAENVPGAILVHKAGGDGEILFVNDEMVELFECDSLADFMEYTGGTFKGVPHPDDGVHVYEEAVRQVNLDDVGAKDYIDFRIVTKTGKIKHVADNGHLVEVEGVGKVFYVLMVDMDERARA